MATVYILHSKTLDRYYIGSCLDMSKRLEDHLSGNYKGSYTSKADDWVLYFSIDNLGYKQAREIEQHIKKMKSRKYIENLKSYKEMVSRLVAKFASIK